MVFATRDGRDNECAVVICASAERMDDAAIGWPIKCRKEVWTLIEGGRDRRIEVPVV
jgi:hypothetical protein